jgi:hypothetical protein
MGLIDDAADAVTIRSPTAAAGAHGAAAGEHVAEGGGDGGRGVPVAAAVRVGPGLPDAAVPAAARRAMTLEGCQVVFSKSIIPYKI